MRYCNTQLRNQLIISSLRINSFEIRDAIGFEDDWLTGLRLLLDGCSRSDCTKLSQLLDQANEHNQLVTVIEPDIRNVTVLKKSMIVKLNDVIATFFQTKREILAAIARCDVIRDYAHRNSIERHTQDFSNHLTDVASPQDYNDLIQQSLQLSTESQTNQPKAVSAS